MHKNYTRLPLLFVLLIFVASCSRKTVSTTTSNTINDTNAVTVWLTNTDKSALFAQQKPIAFTSITNANPTITIDETQRYQTMDGFGYALTGGSAMLINKMSALERGALLKELFATNDNNIGVSYLRISIGASDLDDHVFSYDDLPKGQTDPMMKRFSLAEDKKNLIPVLKQILEINPKIKILGSPWSPPTWMKTNDSTKGGSLKPEFYDAYARYFVKYIQEMKEEGIRIDAITVQNEPLHPGNNPSLLMLPLEQAAFIKKSLGPAFEQNKIDTKIIIYDHNADRPDYPITILNDRVARKYIDGSAFHLYGGKIDALSTVHEAHPDKNLYFTEQWIGAPGNFPEDLNWHVKTLIIGAPRNWCRTVIEWNLAADPHQNPHTPGGCTQCLGAITIDSNKITRNPAYYIIAHASKFVRPGSVRISTNVPLNLPNVAYTTPDGGKVLIVINDSKASQTFNLSYNNKKAVCTLQAGSVATYVWK